MNDNINYIRFIAKKIKIKNLKVKKKYFILQKKNKRFLKLIKNDKIKTLSTQRHKIIKINKNLFAKNFKLKQ